MCVFFISRYALLLRYTSAQSYKLLLEQLPLPSFSLLKKLTSGSVDSLKCAEKLRLVGSISDDITLMVDEMYLKECSQYHGGEYYGENSDGVLYSGIVVFMIIGLLHSVPIVVKTCPETSIDGNWLSKEMDDCIMKLSKYGFKVRALVADNHSSNVKAFSNLLNFFNGEQIFIQHPAYGNQLKTYLFYDMVHIIKNVRNNLLNSKKFVFPAFNFDQLRDKIFVPNG